MSHLSFGLTLLRDHQVRVLRCASNIELDDFRRQPTMFNGRKRAVARDSQAAAYESADNISIRPDCRHVGLAARWDRQAFLDGM
jgi:hypothetical protein